MNTSAPGTHSIRHDLEAREETWLCAGAAHAAAATRVISEPESDLRTAYQRDRDRILHCKAFRRLKHKTQVFISPSGDHVRTRLTHTLEVTQIARTIARALRLNEDLVEAIGLGHDLGHTPFGHAGERALATVFPGFRHNEQSLRVVDLLEKDGHGLNLTDDTRDGILRHSKPDAAIAGEMAGRPATAEAQIVKVADGVAYINHDLDDAIRAGLLNVGDVPPLALRVLGQSHAQRIDTLVRDIVASSAAHVQEPVCGRVVIQMSPTVEEAADVLRQCLFDRVYGPVNLQPGTDHARRIITDLFHWYLDHPDAVRDAHPLAVTDDSIERQTADVISSMTDRFALRTWERLFLVGHEER